MTDLRKKRRRKNVKTFLLVLFIFLPIPFQITNSQNVSPFSDSEFHLEESRKINIILCGINKSQVDESVILETFNGSFRSETPYESTISVQTYSTTISYMSQENYNTFSEIVYQESSWSEKNSSFIIDYEKFILITNSMSKIQYYDLYEIYVINFETIQSPFYKTGEVYINYTNDDLDMRKPSIIRKKYSNYGVSFSNPEKPIIGLLLSSTPIFEERKFPSIRELMDGQITKVEWNSRLSNLLNDAILSKFNPSPVFRYGCHSKINLHMCMIGLDNGHSQEEMLGYINQTLITAELEELLMVSTVKTELFILNADDDLLNISNSSYESYSQWVYEITNHLRDRSTKYWNTQIFLPETDYNQPLDLYIAIMYGEASNLPWSESNAGISSFISETSEYGGFSLITLNYENIFSSNEGFTLTTIHEIGHLFGLVHPHDYWEPEGNYVDYAWSWGFTNSYMTYLSTGTDWDYFDRLLVWREQVFSLLLQMSEYDFQDQQIKILSKNLLSGRFISLEEKLNNLIVINNDYESRLEFHILFNNVLVPLIAVSSIITIFLVILRRKTNRI